MSINPSRCKMYHNKILEILEKIYFDEKCVCVSFDIKSEEIYLEWLILKIT